MTADLKILLDTIDQLKTQHWAGITPTFGQLDELFDSAARVRHNVAAIAAGLTPPAPPRASGQLTLEHVACAPIRITVEYGQAARVVLDALPAAVSGR
jgi:hypothetical protein